MIAYQSEVRARNGRIQYRSPLVASREAAVEAAFGSNVSAKECSTASAAFDADSLDAIRGLAGDRFTCQSDIQFHRRPR